jgi:hypothetical protein
MIQSLFPKALVALTLAATAQFALAADGVSIAEKEGKLRIEIGGQFFSEYHFKDVSRPFLYPVLGPAGEAYTRNYPMKQVPGEATDHIHHRSLWYAHGSINGVDFWAEQPHGKGSPGKTVHEKFLEVKGGATSGVIQSLNKLVAPDGKVVGTDVRTMRILSRKDDRIVDFEVEILASHGELVLGDTKEGAMAIRVAESMRLTQPKGQPAGKGHIVNSEGVRDGQTWGKRAKWVDYHGPVGSQTLGIALFDHPSNPRHPTWWHVRDYGLFAANPFGQHDFEADKQNPTKGNLTVPAGKSVTFKYRFYFHTGDEKAGKVAERYAEYIQSK